MTSRINMRFASVSICLIALAAVANSQQVITYVTSQGGDRISAKPVIRFRLVANTRENFRIDDAVRDQEIVGFGASFLESGMICLNSLDHEGQEKVLRSLFDLGSGAGFTAMKTVIGATDFMAAGPFYSYDDHPGDTALKFFSIERDLKENGLIPYIRRARQYGHFVLQAPMDYPPDWMLVGGKNQDVNPQYFPALARYYVKYAQAYQKAGVFIDFVSLFNEPSIYTKISPDMVRDLLRDDVGPAFTKEGLKNGIQACEPNTRKNALRYLPVILEDPKARKYVGSIAYHGYEYKDYDKIVALHHRYPELKLWMTEVCHSYDTDTSRKHPMPYLDYADGDFWGNRIFDDLEVGTSAWIYWNMILDQNGGPWLVSPKHEDFDKNNQHPIVVIDRQKHEVTYTGLYYYLSHFSKFVRPGAVRLQSTGSMKGVRCVVFRSKDGGLVMEVMNSLKQPTSPVVKWRDRTLTLNLPAMSISTYLWKG